MTKVEITAEAPNPLTPQPATPAIKYSYTLVFDVGKGKLSSSGSHSRYPWHELIVGGFEPLEAAPPSGPFGTPGDLYAPMVPAKSKELDIEKY